MVDPDLGGDPNDFAPADLQKKTRREFLLQAGLLNFGLLTAGSGLIFIMFTEDLMTGTIFLGVGLLTLAMASLRYITSAP